IPPPPHHSTLSLHDALPIYHRHHGLFNKFQKFRPTAGSRTRCSQLGRGKVQRAFLIVISAVGIGKSDHYKFRYNTIINERAINRSEEHTSELQSRENLVCRL